MKTSKTRHVSLVDYGPVCGGSGVEGFFREPYWYHLPLKATLPGLFSFRGSTFVAKTTTLEKKAGNMPLKADGITPQEFFPDCIQVYPLKRLALNAVGLSGPGAEFLFEQNRWQQRTDPFFLSFMSVEKNMTDRLIELEDFVRVFEYYLPGFKSRRVALQINFSCPNIGSHVGGNSNEAVEEICTMLEIAQNFLDIPLVVKLSVNFPVHLAKLVNDHPYCDGLCVSNTVPWNVANDDWKLKHFGSLVSPLADYGGGGISGKYLLPLAVAWIHEARFKTGITKHINGGGGILSGDDVRLFGAAGASSIFFASAAFLAPWNLQDIIKTAHQVLNNR